MKDNSLKKLKKINEPGDSVANWQLKASNFNYDVEPTAAGKIAQLRMFIVLTPGSRNDEFVEKQEALEKELEE